MATSQEYIDFVAEQIAPFGAVTARKMFGEYVLYLNGKGILTVCDNAVFVKKYPELEALMQGAACGAPYPGAKEHYLLDPEDHALLEQLIPKLEALTPLPKPRRKRPAPDA